MVIRMLSGTFSISGDWSKVVRRHSTPSRAMLASFLQGPLVKTVIPAHLAAQALLYVLSLQPQTGSYCWVQKQSAMMFSLQGFWVWQDAAANNRRSGRRYVFFILLVFFNWLPLKGRG